MDKIIEDISVVGPESQSESCEVFRVSKDQNTGKTRKLYIESYGCQMNFSDSEIVASILAQEGFDTTSNLEHADVVFLNTCSIREKAEQTVRNRLNHINAFKKQKPDLLVGVLGCMAERLNQSFLKRRKSLTL
jgi:tRNA-2-methylthio-N6-dimethylallyladenosine synthase